MTESIFLESTVNSGDFYDDDSWKILNVPMSVVYFMH